MSMGAEIDLLTERMESFIDQLERLPEGAFLEKMDGWSPRDTFAHLVGWTYLTRDACTQIRAGQVPGFYADPGEDYEKVNASLVARFASRDFGELVRQQRAAHAELVEYLRGLDPADWDRDFGVRVQGNTETIQGLVAAVSEDFEAHAAQIASWLETRTGS
jgi:hypothetical protein